MLKYIYISLFLFSFSVLFSQNDDKWQPARGFTLGINLVEPVTAIFSDERAGVSFLSRISFKNNLNFFAEAGFENISFKRERYDYDSNGSFFKVGIENDMLKKKDVGKNDNLLIGLLYGYAFQEQKVPYLFITNGYWDDYTGQFKTYTVNSHWLELTFGPRMELFTNFFVSWGFHLKVTVYRNNPDILDPYIIPGYGNGKNKINGAFSYNLEYLIPWKR
ncbi:MAG: DUF6048 family protein [Marinilabiliaceae bacterium]|nr:DUF6048 family protein [Marinilabiliaceae bacterium]